MLSPQTRRRLHTFKSNRRAYYSVILLALIFLLALCADFLANSKPLIVRYNHKFYFPVFKNYSQHDILQNNIHTPLNFKKLRKNANWQKNPKNFALWPPIKYSANENVNSQELQITPELEIRLETRPQIAHFDLDIKTNKIIRSHGGDKFFTGTLKNRKFKEIVLEFFAKANDSSGANDANILLHAFDEANAKRAQNQNAPEFRFERNDITISSPAYKTRSRSPRKWRVIIEKKAKKRKTNNFKIKSEKKIAEQLEAKIPEFWREISRTKKNELISYVTDYFKRTQTSTNVYDNDDSKTWQHNTFTLNIAKPKVNFPYKPCENHPLGLDNSGRDVLAIIIYAARLSLYFGLALALSATILGILFGAVQGFFAGRVDILGQRFIEIWESLPFLFIVIFLGSVFGRSFGLLLAVYAAFNWIALSYYMRAEFLRLRKTSFVEAATVLGANPSRLLFKHILPNALAPVITLFPFSLVSAIFALSALDYLGFGLPPGSPSWGDLLAQAQEYRRAWWLALYPFLALFCVTLLCVFVGEGAREAFDPRARKT